jgi:hypothetical protein
MREIKFRAWINSEKRMVYDSFSVNANGEISTWGIFAHVIVMQFTGLHDKNGKEIYEGDIVEYENNNAGYGRPRHEEISRDIIPCILEHEEYDRKLYWVDGEVIGNIYANPLSEYFQLS